MTVAVTGASGHVGANLVRALLEEGRDVRVLVHNDTKALEGLDVEKVEGDLHDEAALRRLVKDTEAVYHTAAKISLLNNNYAPLRRINVDGTRNVMQACMDENAGRLIHFSSIHAMTQAPLDKELDEKRSLSNSSKHLPYDRTKAESELVIAEGIEQGLDAVIVTPTSVIGRNDFKPSFMGTVVRWLCSGYFPSLVTYGYDWVDVRDLVQGALLVEKKGRSGEKYLLSGSFHTFRELAEVIMPMCGRQAPSWDCPMWLAKAFAPFAELDLKRLEFLRFTRSIRLESWKKPTRISVMRKRSVNWGTPSIHSKKPWKIPSAGSTIKN